MFNAEEGTVITEHEILSSTANQGLVGFHKDFLQYYIELIAGFFKYIFENRKKY